MARSYLLILVFCFCSLGGADGEGPGWTGTLTCPPFGDNTDVGSFTLTNDSVFPAPGGAARVSGFPEISFRSYPFHRQL